MFKLLLVLAFVCSAKSHYFGDVFTIFLNSEEVRDRFHKFTARFATDCDNYSEQFYKSAKLMSKCINTTYNPLEMNICQYVDQKLPACLMPVKQTLDNCLVKQSKPVTSLLIQMGMAWSKKFCNEPISRTFEITSDVCNVNAKIGRVCGQDESNDRIIDMLLSPTPVTVERICLFGSKQRNCMKDILEEGCPRNITKSIYFEYFDTVWTPCQNLKSSANMDTKS